MLLFTSYVITSMTSMFLWYLSIDWTVFFESIMKQNWIFRNSLIVQFPSDIDRSSSYNSSQLICWTDHDAKLLFSSEVEKKADVERRPVQRIQGRAVIKCCKALFRCDAGNSNREHSKCINVDSSKKRNNFRRSLTSCSTWSVVCCKRTIASRLQWTVLRGPNGTALVQHGTSRTFLTISKLIDKPGLLPLIDLIPRIFFLSYANYKHEPHSQSWKIIINKCKKQFF